MPMLQQPAHLLCFCLAGFLASATVQAQDPVVIVSPKDGDVVPSQFSVKITYGSVEYCDTDSCELFPADWIHLGADEMLLKQCLPPCPNDGEIEFELMLDPGPHELIATAAYHSSVIPSEIVKITVEAAGTGGASDSTGAGSSTSSGEDGTTGESASSVGEPANKDGCTCDTTGLPGSGLGWLGLGWLALLGRRGRGGRARRVQ